MLYRFGRPTYFSFKTHFVPRRFSDLQKTECYSLLCSMRST